MAFFLQSEAARRYSNYRPKMHSELLRMVEVHFPPVKFKSAIDVACGTGDSLLPLKKYAESIYGVDASCEMLEYARAKGLPVQCRDVLSIDESRKFDLITTCMAFHWFDQEKAIRKFKAISQPGALWLIYHFAFAGHSTNASFNTWFNQTYLNRYPSPARHAMEGTNVNQDQDAILLAKGDGNFEIEFDRLSLVGYLTTQSNVEKAVSAGKPYPHIEAELLNELKDIPVEGAFNYYYAYDLFQYAGS